MSAAAAFRSFSRVGAARFVAGMRVSSLASSVVRPATLRAVAGGARTFSATTGRLGSGTSVYYLLLRRVSKHSVTYMLLYVSGHCSLSEDSRGTQV
jgi:hypothetical protein